MAISPTICSSRAPSQSPLHFYVLNAQALKFSHKIDTLLSYLCTTLASSIVCICETWLDATFPPALLEKFRDPVDLPGAGPPIHFRHFPPQFVPIPLHKAAHHKKLLKLSFPLFFGHFEYGVDGFFNCRLDESARVDDRDIRFFQCPGERVSLLRQPPQDVLAVDQVFGAAQANDADSWFSFHVVRGQSREW